MEEKNELNDIILNKGGASGNSKKLLLAIATLTLILIIVLVIMNSLKSESDQQVPKAVLPPEPTAPTEIIDDPLFEPVEVIQEGQDQNAGTGGEDLNQIAQKIKQESMQPTVEPVMVPVEPAASQPAKTIVKPAPVVQPVQKQEPVALPKQAPAKTSATIKTQPAPVKQAPTKTAPVVKNEPAVKPVGTATIKQTKTSASAATEPKAPVIEPKADSAAKAVSSTETYYIQVGSFTKQPNQTLFDRLNASGLKYTTIPAGNATKVMVGPFQGEKAARDVLGTVRKNVEPGAYITKG